MRDNVLKRDCVNVIKSCDEHNNEETRSTSTTTGSLLVAGGEGGGGGINPHLLKIRIVFDAAIAITQQGAGPEFTTEPELVRWCSAERRR